MEILFAPRSVIKEVRRYTKRPNPFMKFLILLFVLTTIPVFAWSPPSCTSTEEMRCDASVKAGSKYHDKGHAYIIEHAIEILRNDGYENWADIAWQNRQDLFDGAMWADNAGPDVRIVGYHRVLWEVWEGWSWSPCNLASLEHFHNPQRDVPGKSPGLNLGDWGTLKDALGIGFATAFTTIGTAGIYSHTVTVEPDIFHQQKSAATLCQECYHKAINAYNGSGTLPNRSNLQTAMFYLGWSAHLVGDLGVTQHTWDSWITHDDYEHFANEKGGDKYYHATSGRDPKKGINAYQFNWPAHRFAKENAKYVHTWEQFQWAEGQGSKNTIDDDILRLCGSRGSTNFHQALSVGMPVTEMYTAGLIAKFMQQAGIPAKTPPLKGGIYDKSKNAIPGAYVFYRIAKPVHVAPPANQPKHTGSVSYKPEHGVWDYVRTDKKGRFTIGAMKPGSSYFLRPAMPGYLFDGSASGEGGGLTEFMKRTPIVYSHQHGMSSPHVNFYLKPQGGMKLAVAKFAQGTVASKHPALLLPSKEATKLLVKANTPLSKSATSVSPGLSENIQRASMQINSNGYVIAVPNSSIGISPEAYVTIQLNRLLDAKTGEIAQSPSQVIKVIDASRLELKQKPPAVVTMANPQPIEPKMVMQSAQILHKSLPTIQVIGPDKKQKNIVVIPDVDDGFPSQHSLLSNGLIPVPSMAGAHIRVEVISGPGYIPATGSGPITIVTNAAGKAAFNIRAGSEAGKTRLKMTVVKHPAAVNILPQAYTEFMVHPAVKGPDPIQRAPVTLRVAPLMITGTVMPIPKPGPSVVMLKPQGEMVDREPTRIDPSRIEERTDIDPAEVAVAMSENFDTQPIRGWELLENAKIGPIENSRALTLNGPGHGFWITMQRSDFDLQFRYRHGHGEGDVIFRASGEPPKNQEYHLILTNDHIHLLKISGGEKPLGSAPFHLQTGSWYNIKLKVIGSNIQVFVNNEAVLSAFDEQALPVGTIGFGCNEGSGFAYDDIAVK